MFPIPKIAATVAFGAFLAACGADDAQNANVSTADSPAHSIDWFSGTVEEAFADASAAEKPIFLYWGAEWCPYCKQVKATVFTRHDFIDRTRLFVPVYLDGDAEEAQRTGERFRVYGYPTMIVFRADGTELTRIPGGLDPEAYATILDLALTAIRPVIAIVAAVINGEQVSDDDYRRLAYYSWGQDNEGVLAGRDETDTYSAISESCTDSESAACMRLYLRYLLSAVDESDEAATPGITLSAEEHQRAVRQLTLLLSDASLIAANLDTVLLEGPELLAAITKSTDPERAELTAQWGSVLDALADNPSVTTVERLYASYGPIGFLTMDDAETPIPEEMQAAVLARVTRADRATTDPLERHAVIATAGSVLRAARLHEQADVLLQAELERSKEPYYFMSYLATSAERSGRHEESIAWRKRAYDEASGETTRFRWGTSYVISLIELAPDDSDAIEAAVQALFRELEDPTVAFYGSTKSRAERLFNALRDWSETHDQQETLGRLQAHVGSICSSIVVNEAAHENCSGALATEEARL